MAGTFRHLFTALEMELPSLRAFPALDFKRRRLLADARQDHAQTVDHIPPDDGWGHLAFGSEHSRSTHPEPMIDGMPPRLRPTWTLCLLQLTRLVFRSLLVSEIFFLSSNRVDRGPGVFEESMTVNDVMAS